MNKIRMTVLGTLLAASGAVGLHLYADEAIVDNPAWPAKGDNLEVIGQDSSKRAMIDTTSIKEVSPHIMEAKTLIILLDEGSNIAAQNSIYEANCITMEYYVHDTVFLDVNAKVVGKSDSPMTNFRKVPPNTPAASFWEFLCKAPLNGAEAHL